MIRNIFIIFVVISIKIVKNEGINVGSMEQARMAENLIFCNDTEPEKPKLCINIGRVVDFGKDVNHSNNLNQDFGEFLGDFFSRSLTASSLYGTLFWIMLGIIIGQLAGDAIFLVKRLL